MSGYQSRQIVGQTLYTTSFRNAVQPVLRNLHCAVTCTQHGTGHSSISVGVSACLHYLPQRRLEPQRRSGGPQTRLHSQQSVTNQFLFLTEPGGIRDHGGSVLNRGQNLHGV